MRRSAFLILVCAVAALPDLRAQTPGSQAPPRRAVAASTPMLPVRRVVLYKNGIGYFEHVGRARGNETLAIDFNSAQLNDVLQSLTTLDLGGGRIVGVLFDSEAPLGQRLGALALPTGQNASVTELLGALRGARLAVHSPSGIVNGHLLSVERRAHRKDQTDVDEITVVSDFGEIRFGGAHARGASEVPRARSVITGQQLPRAARREPRAGLTPDDDFDGRDWRARRPRELRQRSAALENDVPARDAFGWTRKTAAPGMGHCRQHDRRRLGTTSNCRSWWARRSVHSAALSAALHSAAGRRHRAHDCARAANPPGDADDERKRFVGPVRVSPLTARPLPHRVQPERISRTDVRTRRLQGCASVAAGRGAANPTIE